MNRKIIFDCDIGCDDAVALIALLQSKDVDVIGITCVKGNLPVDDVVNNALKVSELCNKKVPVYRGCEEPMVRGLFPGRTYNTLMQTVVKKKDGKTVLIHDPDFPIPLPDRKAEKEHACTYLIDTLKNSEEKIDICAVGPLTNLGMAFRLDPSIVEHIGTIYIMGGGLYIGNRTPVAEANFYDDPEAAEIVLNSGAHCVVFPIEACEMGATYDTEDLKQIEAIGSDLSSFLNEELKGYIDRCNYLFDVDSTSCCAYDYAAAAAILDETVITEKRKDIVHIDISGGMADGQMVIDRRGMYPNELPVEVVYRMDSEKIHRLLLDLITEKQ